MVDQIRDDLSKEAFMARGLSTTEPLESDLFPSPGLHMVGIRTFKLHRLQTWVDSHLGSIVHEKRVARLALELFDLTRAQHGLTLEHRRILRMACLVHDVGRCKGDKNHEIRGAEMLLRDRALPLTPPERRVVAYLTRYHRGDVPDLGDDEILSRGDGRAASLRLLALLCAADALDCRSLPSPDLQLALHGDQLHIRCTVGSDVSITRARRAYLREKKFRLVERVLGCRVSIKLRRTDFKPRPTLTLTPPPASTPRRVTLLAR